MTRPFSVVASPMASRLSALAAAAMDGEMAGDVETLIQTWVDAASSRAFIWISHSEEQLARVANRRVVMKGGRLGLRET